MSRVAYVNGRYLPFAEAKVHVEDRGYQLADGIVYLQVTRGVAKRDHAFPRTGEPSLVLTARATRPRTAEWRTGVGVITIPDIRWKRPDIKSIALLPNVLGKQQAVEAGAFEAWMVDDDGFVTEGTSTNAWIVTRKGELVTHQADTSILHGVTRAVVLEAAGGAGLEVVERPFTVAEAKRAAEAFLTSTTSAVMPVVRIDGAPVGDGKPGAVTRRLMQLVERADDGG
jgi:D-alanine transaminase